VNEIDRDFYCSANTYDVTANERDRCRFGGMGMEKPCDYTECYCYHRKYPTPEQFRQEYGEDVPDDMAVLVSVLSANGDWTPWTLHFWGQVKNEYYRADGSVDSTMRVVIACTPFGRPADTWRPE
jgi:hypothetical protein